MGEYAVQKVVAQYCQSIDDGRLDDIVALFAADGVLDVSSFGIRKKGREAVRAQFVQMLDPQTKGMHCTFNPVISVSGSEAHGQFDYFWMSFKGQPRIGIAGRYHVRLAASGQSWLIREMKVEVRTDLAYVSGA
jgi:ketosteroid isomerase-like protein